MATSVTRIEQSHLHYIVSSAVLLRVGGLPMEVVDALRFTGSMRWIEALLTIEKELSECKDRLVDSLHEAVNVHKEQKEIRRRLINLKRDVFNQRMPKDIPAQRTLADMLAPSDRVLLVTWLDLWERYQLTLDEGERIFLAEFGRQRALLKQIIENDDFRKGILLASPDLDRAIDTYVATDAAPNSRNARTAERSIFEYLLRTACKTSPFGTFNAVCAGSFERLAGMPDIVYQLESMRKRSFTRLNVHILSHISSLLLANESIRDDLPVQLTPGWHIQNGRIRYLRRIQDDDHIDPNAPVAFNMVHEDVFYLRVGNLLRSLLELLGRERKMRYREVVTALCRFPDYQGEEEKIDAFLQHLLRLGLLIVPDLQQDLHSARPVSSYVQGLLNIGIETTAALAQKMRYVETLVDRYATAPIGERRALLAEVRQQVRLCFEELGEAHAPVPRTIIYEDTTLSPQRLVVNKESWQPILSSVAELQQLLPAFDVSLPRKLVTRGFFHARHGVGQRCDDFLAFAYDFRQNFFEHYLQESSRAMRRKKSKQRMNYFQQREFTMLESARQRITEYVNAAYEQLAPGSQELRLDEAFVSAIVPHIPQNTVNFASHTFFSQFARVQDEPLLVINRVYAGLTLMFSRFAHFFSEDEGHQLIPMLKAALRQCQPPGAVFAELKGAYEATNLNIHPQVTEYELVCPGDISTRPAEEQIPLGDLWIQDDVEAGCLRLYSRRLGKEIIPVYLGFLLPLALPEMQQVLLNFSYTTMCPLDLWEGSVVEQQEGPVYYYPRLRYKNLVLQRATWKMSPDVFPKRAGEQSDSEFFLSVNRWRARHALPARVFVAPEMAMRANTVETVEGGMAGQRMRTFKPFYVDFENYFSVTLLEALVRDLGKRLVLTEMLPDHDQLWLKHDGQSYVSEFVWEMSSHKGGYHG